MTLPVGVLTRDDIVQEIQADRLVDGPIEQAHGCSYDLTVGTIFWNEQIIPPGQAKTVYVPPGGIVGIFTAEELSLPDDVCATAFAINAMSSRGFLVLNPGHIDPGFKGPLTVKALNIRKTPIAIHQNDPIFTVIFHHLSKPTIPFDRNRSRAEREREFDATTVETSPRSISEIVAADTSGPFPSRSDVEVIVKKYWVTRWSLIFSVVTVIFSIITICLAGAATYFSYTQLQLSSNGVGEHASHVRNESDDPSMVKNQVERMGAKQSTDQGVAKLPPVGSGKK